MALVMTINSSCQFRDLMKECGYGDSLSYQALGMIFEHLDVASGDIEFEPSEIVCQYDEYTMDEIIAEYELTEDDISEEDVYDFVEQNFELLGVTKNGSFVVAKR